MEPEWIDALLSGEWPEERCRAIEASLEKDDEARSELIRQASVDAALKELWRDDSGHQTSEAFAKGVMARLESVGGRAVARSVLSEIIEEREWRAKTHLWWGWRRRAEVRRRDREDRQRFQSDWWKAAAVAALLVGIGIVVLQSVSLTQGSRITVAPGLKGVYLARVTSHQDAAWATPSLQQIREDGWVKEGRLDLLTGHAEVAFNNGAKVLLEGPVVFSVETDARGFLEQGRIAAEAGGKASGFVVNTPRLTAVDVGTRFGITVGGTGESEVHVLQGAVEVSRVSGNSVPLLVREGGAVRADDRPLSQLAHVEFRGEDYALPAAPVSDLHLPFIRYQFEGTGGILKQNGMGLSGSAYEASLLSDAEFPGKPKRSPGIFGNALVFRNTEGLSLGSVGRFEENSGFTASFWAKLPPNEDSLVEGGNLLTLVDPENHPLWQASWNGDGELGAIGALRVSGQGGGACTATTDLRDGRWHHLAVRYVGGDGGLGMLTHLYVDGKIERISALRSGSLGLSGERGDSRLVLGALPSQSVRGFTGQVDEVHFFQGAASPALIQKHAAEGALNVLSGQD